MQIPSRVCSRWSTSPLCQGTQCKQYTVDAINKHREWIVTPVQSANTGNAQRHTYTINKHGLCTVSHLYNQQTQAIDSVTPIQSTNTGNGQCHTYTINKHRQLTVSHLYNQQTQAMHSVTPIQSTNTGNGQRHTYTINKHDYGIVYVTVLSEIAILCLLALRLDHGKVVSVSTETGSCMGTI